jgi:type 1 glutamine amidotransferase
MPAADRKVVTPRIKWRALLLALLAGVSYSSSSSAMRVLVFSKVQEGAYRHASIPNGIKALHEIGASKGWQIDDTIDARAFNSKNLSQYDVIVWNNTGGDVLDANEQAAFQEFIHRGGGYVGIHMSVAGNGATEPSWPWYADLVGARFKQHPTGTPTANIVGASDRNPSINGLPDPWSHADEWYEWVEDPSDKPAMYMLLYVDEKSYGGGTSYHPVAWCHEFEGGRAFYTALGHPEESFSEENFLKHLAGGIEWASAHSPNLKTPITLAINGLIVDLDADKGLTLEDGNKVAAWKNQVSTFVAQSFVKRDEGRSTPGSGRPVLKRSVPALSGHNSLVFRESELVNMDEDAFDHLITGSGYTWLVVMTPYIQIGRAPNVNVFLGDLKNGGLYEGFWGGLDDDNTLWMGSRNGITFGRYDANNPKVTGPRLQRDQYYIVAGRMASGLGAVSTELFVDSANPVASQIFAVNPNSNSSRLSVGQERDAVNHPGLESFDGELVRVLIWDRPLNDTDLTNTINSLKLTYFQATPK